MRTLGLFVLCAALIFTGNAAPVEKRRESTKEILELESLLKKSAGEDKQVFPSQLQKEAKAKEAKLAAEAAAKEKEEEQGAVDLPPVPPEMQVDGLAEQDELSAQLKQQKLAAEEEQKEQEVETESNDGEESQATKEETEQTNEEEPEDTEDEPEMMDAAAKREQELFMRYLRESPELWQQLMDSLEYGNDESDLQQGRYATPEDEYPAVMQEWRTAADNNQNYLPQNGYESELNQEQEAPEELENELPQVPGEFNNLEELQEYYSDKVAEENAKKLGYGRPDWVDQNQEEDMSRELENVDADTEDEHLAQKRSSSIQDHLIM